MDPGSRGSRRVKFDVPPFAGDGTNRFYFFSVESNKGKEHLFHEILLEDRINLVR